MITPHHRFTTLQPARLLLCLLPIVAAQNPVNAQAGRLISSGFETGEIGMSCVEKSVRTVNGRRLNFAFPNRDDQSPGSVVESACLRFTGVVPGENLTTTRGATISRNGGPFAASPISISEGDSIVLRLPAPVTPDASETSQVGFGGAILGSYTVRARNAAGAPGLYQVGPGQPFRELTEVADFLQAGDTVELQRGAVYQSVEFSRAGRASAPIVVRAANGPGMAPRLIGGSHTLSLRGAHHYRIQGLDISAGIQTCVRVEANDVELRDSRVHGCPRHGVLGADFNSGSLRLEAVEVDDSGGVLAGENLKHPVYVATDRDRYPGAILKIERSYIHDFGGIGVKSRAERAEIHNNWIEADERGLYTLEFNGYEEYEPAPGLQADVFGNVLIHRHVFGIRMGGDGTGALRGRVRLAHNTLLQGSAFDVFTPVLRFFGELDAVCLRNNVFARLEEAGPDRPLRIVRDDAIWLRGARALDAVDNAVPVGSDAIAAGYLPAEFIETRFFTTPGYHDLDITTLDLERVAGAAIEGVAFPSVGPAGTSVNTPLQHVSALPPPRRPQSGLPVGPQWIEQAPALPEALGAR